MEEDTEEMKEWRELNQSEIDICWKKLAERMEEDVLDKCKVEESKRGAFTGRSDPLIWRKVRKNKRYKIRKWVEDCWARVFSWCREYNLQRSQRKQEESTVEEEMKQQQRMTIIERSEKENQIKRKDGCQKPTVGLGFAGEGL